MQAIAGGGGFSESSKTFHVRTKEPQCAIATLAKYHAACRRPACSCTTGFMPNGKISGQAATVFGLWTEPKPKTGRPLCQCGWSGLPHYRTTGLGLAAGGDRQAVPGVDARRGCGAAPQVPSRPRRGCGPAKARGATFPRGAVGAGRSADRRASRAVTTLSFKMAQKVGDY